jgi:hypothetical protein
MREVVYRERQLLFQKRKNAMALQKRLYEIQMHSLSISVTQRASLKQDDLFQQTHQALADLNDQERLVRDHETKLGSLEYHMGRREARLYDSVFLTGKDPIVDYEIGSAGVALIQETDEESVSQPSLVEKYYDRAGDKDIFRERLQELEEEHLEEKAAREAARRQGKQPMPPERVFLETYFGERTTMIQEFLQAKQEAAMLRKQCLVAGHAIDDVSEEESQEQLDHSWRVKDHLQRDRSRMDVLTDVQYLGSMPLEFLLFGEQTPTERIKDWLKATLKTTVSRGSTWEDGDRAQSEGIPEPAGPRTTPPSVTFTENGHPGHVVAPFDASSPKLQGLDGKAQRLTEWPGEEGLSRRYSEPSIAGLDIPPRTRMEEHNSDKRPQSTA